MKSIAKSEPCSPDESETQAVQVFLPKKLARHAKSTAAEKGWSLRELVKNALEQYLGTEGKAA